MMSKSALSLFALIIFVFGNIVIVAQSNMKPPVPKKEPKVLKIHGYEIVDNYAWMRDRSEKKATEIIQYLEEENAYTASVMGKHQPMADAIYDEMLGRIKQDDASVPYKLGDYWYFTKTFEGKQYPAYLRARSADLSDAQILLDQNEMAKGFQYFSVGFFEPSDDGNLLAFATDTTGYRQYLLQIKDLRTGEMLPNKIERVTSIEWSPDGSTLFYAQEDPESKRSDKLFKHDIKAQKDTLIYEEKEVSFNSGIGRSRDKQMYFIYSYAANSTEWRYLPANAINGGQFTVLAPRREGHEYAADFDKGEFYIRTNKNAPNFKVVRASQKDPSERNWKDFIVHRPAIKVEDISFFKDFAVVSERENGLEYIRVMDRKTRRADVRIPTEESVYTMDLSTNPEYDQSAVRYVYSSMITPNSTFEFDMRTRKSRLLKQQEIPSGYDRTKYETSRIWVVARDGVKVPVSLMMKKGTKLDGKSPMLLYGYGSYGISMTPNFSTARLSLVDRGMIYAIAHIRGGSELGEGWRQDGRMFKKMNTFNDFVDCSKWVIANKYTSADRLVIQGGSAGGLLMGAVMNQAPELYRAAIVQVPFVDVMNTMIDDTLPLTTEEWVEWGNPRDDKKAWDYMYQYSPYDQIQKKAYPNMLVEASINDSQVPYWEASKYVAKVREMKTNDSTILLKMNMGAGHGGASGRFDRLKEVAFSYTYALTQVGINK